MENPRLQVNSPVSLQNSFEHAGQNIPRSISNGISPETDRLLNKWLKMQITQVYWGVIFKILTIVFVIGSMIYSTKALMPLLEGMLPTLQGSSLENSKNNTNQKLIQMVDQLKK